MKRNGCINPLGWVVLLQHMSGDRATVYLS